MIDAVSQTCPVEHVERASACLRGSGADEQQRKFDVLHSGEHRYEVERLEDESHRPRPVSGALTVGHGEQVASVDFDPAVIDVVQPGQAVEQGGLPGSGRAHDPDQFPGGDGQIQVAQRLDLDAAAAVDRANLSGDKQRLLAHIITGHPLHGGPSEANGPSVEGIWP
jgi:hypothetical protein